jgi:murein DD-endopeptidase MepM/ murein hydrolase activator NlpD
LTRWRLPAGKKLTFLYVPDDADVRQFRVPRVAFYGAAGVVAVGLTLLGFFGVRYLGALAEGREMLRLRGENIELHDQLASVQSQLDVLRNEMDAGLEVQQKLRLLASLDPIHPDVFEAGVGGPVVQGGRGTLPPDLEEDLETTSTRLSQMLRQASMQRDSYNEILAVLREKQDVWDRTPSTRPVHHGFISSRFGRRMDPFTGQAAMHRGIDIAARRGAPVAATADGRVKRAGRWGAFGLMVEIEHGDGLVTRYAHCHKILVKRGQKVQRGDHIARVGSTGKATASHVHYEVIQNGLHQDPMKYVLPADVVVD